MKELLQEGDVLILKGGIERKYTPEYKWLIDNFYDNDLNCITNDKFTIIKVLRPEYKVIYEKVKKRVRVNEQK